MKNFIFIPLVTWTIFADFAESVISENGPSYRQRDSSLPSQGNIFESIREKPLMTNGIAYMHGKPNGIYHGGGNGPLAYDPLGIQNTSKLPLVGTENGDIVWRTRVPLARIYKNVMYNIIKIQFPETVYRMGKKVESPRPGDVLYRRDKPFAVYNQGWRKIPQSQLHLYKF